MSRIENKSASTRKAKGAARKGSPSRRNEDLTAGDRVRVLDVPANLKAPGYDTKDADRREMRTAELFRFCLGREFTVRGFDKFGYVELEVHKNRAVRAEFGLNTIWIEPELLKRVRRGKRNN